MAFDINGFGRISSTMNGKSNIQWSYKSTTDTIATILADGYFDPVQGRLSNNARILVEASDDVNELVISGLNPVKTEPEGAYKIQITGAITGVITGTANINMVKIKNTVNWQIEDFTANSSGGPGALQIDGSNIPAAFLPGTNNSPLYVVPVQDDLTSKIGLLSILGGSGNMRFSSGAGVFDNFLGGGTTTGWSDINGSYVIEDI